MAANDGLDLITYKDITTAILSEIKGDVEDEKVITRVKQLVNTKLREIYSRKKWKFLRNTNRSLKVTQKVTAGTISITKGDRTVTGVGTAFTQTHRNWFIRPTGATASYRVIAVLNATTLMISSEFTDETIAPGGAYKLYQSEIPLFPDCLDIDDVRLDGQYRPLRPVGPAVINDLKQKFPDREGPPQVYSIEGLAAFFQGPLLGRFILGYDFLGSGTKNIRGISIFPHIPDKDYTLHIPYKLRTDRLERDSDEPLIPIGHRQIIKYGVLSDYFFSDSQNNTGGYWGNLYKIETQDLEAKFLDTDDMLRIQPVPSRRYPHAYLMNHSSTYFDVEG